MAKAKKQNAGYSKNGFTLISMLAVIAILIPIFAAAFGFASVSSFKSDGTVVITNVSLTSVTVLSVISLVISVAALAALAFAIIVCNKEKLSFRVMWIATLSTLVSSVIYMIAGFIAAGAYEELTGAVRTV